MSRAYDRERYRRTRLGLPTTDLVDAEPARRHARRLMQLGWRHTDISAESGATHVITILYGKPSEGILPLERIGSLFSRRILALPLELRPTGSSIDPSGSRRRMQALCAIGHPVVWQARQMGLTTSLASRVVNGTSKGILARHAVTIRAFHEEWWNRPAGPSRESSLAKYTAAQKGYLPSLAWDDDLIDLPEADLDAELGRRVEAMDLAELSRCYRAHFEQGDRSPLIVAGAKALSGRRRALARELEPAA
ncbi:hypothetical protein [Nocardiopsis sp. NPDC058789]|uniref:hypothetical protein n=1 Tax=Nocardiopsis sp. NPDC058789 TaxID=3346634 RepID=UPI00366CFB69